MDLLSVVTHRKMGGFFSVQLGMLSVILIDTILDLVTVVLD